MDWTGPGQISSDNSTTSDELFTENQIKSNLVNFDPLLPISNL